MKVIIYIAIFIILCPIFSCKENEPKNDSFFFYVPGSDIGITTSKRPGNLFYVVFAEDSLKILQDNEFMALAPDTGTLTIPHVLKYPYIEVRIYPSDYTIFTTEYEPVHKCIKEGKTYITW